MTIGPLPLSYCTNVHPGRSLAEVQTGITDFTLEIRSRYGQPLAAGLWLAQPVIRELGEPNQLAGFRDFLADLELPCYTLNAFPYGDFHSDRVKEQVYLPDWTTPARRDYTLACARVLAELLPPDTDGSISTVPLGFKSLSTRPEFLGACQQPLIETAAALARLHAETGRMIRVGIEPEPCCVLETTPETLAFFAQLRERAAEQGQLDAVIEHLGVCYDVCHQSVEFEDVAASLRALNSAGIRINKLHISCAIEVEHPLVEPNRSALRRYIEPRYLHQTFARHTTGRIVQVTDLSENLLDRPSDDFRASDPWRVHFHVPVNAERLGPLRTTRPDLERALAVLPELDYAPHLEVETYTWEVMPDGGRTELAVGFAGELAAAAAMIATVAAR